MVLKKWKNKLSSMSYKYWAVAGHPSQEEHRIIRQEYSTAIMKAKQEHWAAFLEGVSFGDVWTANRYISGEESDGGKMRIPTFSLYSASPAVLPEVALTNEEKSHMLAKLMFLASPMTVK